MNDGKEFLMAFTRHKSEVIDPYRVANVIKSPELEKLMIGIGMILEKEMHLMDFFSNLSYRNMEEKVNGMLTRLEDLETSVTEIQEERDLVKFIEISEKECRKLIIFELENSDEGLFSGEIAMKYRLEPAFVYNVYTKLEKEGIIEFNDD